MYATVEVTFVAKVIITKGLAEAESVKTLKEVALRQSKELIENAISSQVQRIDGSARLSGELIAYKAGKIMIGDEAPVI